MICSSDGCTNQAQKKEECGKRHGGKYICSDDDGCPNQKVGLCKRHEVEVKLCGAAKDAQNMPSEEEK